MQLIHLALRLAWPTNYLSKGHSQALCGSCSLWHSEGKRSPENPANRVLVSEGLTVTLLDPCCQWSDLGQGMP